MSSPWAGWLLLVCVAIGHAWPAFGRDVNASASSGATNISRSYDQDIKPLLEQYCYACHGNGKRKGDFALDTYADEAAIRKDPKAWQTVLHHVRTGEMPPKNKPQPTLEQREAIAAWIEAEVFQCDCAHPDPGRVTLRRLNRTEYNNTIHDLVGIDFQPADDFPSDDVGYGFDNIGDVLSLPPILFEKYLAAAEHVLSTALNTNPPARYPIKRLEAGNLEASAPGGPYGRGARLLAREGELTTKFLFPTDGEYRLRIRAFGQQAGPDPARMDVRIDDQLLQVFDVKAVENAPKTYELRLSVPAGEKCVSAGYINNYVNPKDPDPNNRDRNLIIEWMEISGPIVPEEITMPESYRRIMVCLPSGSEDKRECARRIVRRFAAGAFRRPVSEDELARLMSLFIMADEDGASFDQAVKVVLEAVLVSPHFLFRGERQPAPYHPTEVHPIDEFALASRVSYFLWSTMPDQALEAQAERGTLRQHLEAEVQRLLRDPKARALVDNFAFQWLQVRSLKTAAPDPERFPAFGNELRDAMEKETSLFCESIIRENRSVLDLLDADYTFLNEGLARHYGISGVTGPAFQRVSLKSGQRGGVLTQGSILTLTSNPTRTSPVKRGKWVLENMLGAPPPPPPPDVPALPEGKELAGTLRQRMEQHRDNPLCASCHARMDPIGFGFENFDGIGRWREQDGSNAIDPAGRLVTGEAFQGPAELRHILSTNKKDEFVRCLSEKLLTYALGRGLEYYDKCALDEITAALRQNDYRFSALVLAIVKSPPFQLRRGEGNQLAESK